MKHLSKRFISILLSFAFFVASIILYINYIKPTYAEIKIDQARLALVNQKNQEYADIFGKLKGVADEFKKSPDLQNRVSMTLPLSANTPDSVNQLTAIASANGLKIESIDVVESAITPTPGAKSDSIIKGIGILKNNVRLSGSYAQIKAFFQGVESGVRISSIRSFKIDRVSNSVNPDAFNITLEIETYYQAN